MSEVFVESDGGVIVDPDGSVRGCCCDADEGPVQRSCVGLTDIDVGWDSYCEYTFYPTSGSPNSGSSGGTCVEQGYGLRHWTDYRQLQGVFGCFGNENSQIDSSRKIWYPSLSALGDLEASYDETKTSTLRFKVACWLGNAHFTQYRDEENNAIQECVAFEQIAQALSINWYLTDKNQVVYANGSGPCGGDIPSLQALTSWTGDGELLTFPKRNPWKGCGSYYTAGWTICIGCGCEYVDDTLNVTIEHNIGIIDPDILFGDGIHPSIACTHTQTSELWVEPDKTLLPCSYPESPYEWIQRKVQQLEIKIEAAQLCLPVIES